ncbi:MAG TPA: ATP-binding protein [Draconibacterium sp.]|nr:ATP-binding protein [Draconibacterium sp.]HRX10141.1 ATP-binding protein [Draconibacterium sp.]
MKKRFLFHTIKKYIDHKNALIITGMRQVGKTTLMKQIYDEVEAPKLWFDFDNPLDMLQFEEIDYNKIFRSLEKTLNSSGKRIYVFIDEIQNLPEITKIIKYHIDHFNVKYVVTGSSNYYLKNLFPESLSGRKFLFVLPPLSFCEYLYFHDRLEYVEDIEIDFLSVIEKQSQLEYEKRSMDYENYIEFGGFPEVVLTKDIETKKAVLKNIFSSFFEKDIKILTDIKDIRELRNLILLLVPRTGNILDITKLSGELEINRVKLYSYIEFLQGVFFLDLIPKFSRSIDKTIAGGRKVYFADTGILNIIGKVTEGQLFENAIANQLKEFGDLSFYNQRNTAEIDFILNKEIAFEVKINATEKDLKRTAYLAEKIGIKESYLISRKYNETEKTIFPMFL